MFGGDEQWTESEAHHTLVLIKSGRSSSVKECGMIIM